MATMTDVASATGVSLMTVSNCFKQPHKVHAVTRKKVLDAAAAYEQCIDDWLARRPALS